MICKNIPKQNIYNYSFIEGGKVLLENKDEKFSVKYEDWVKDYYIVDKWNSLKIE